MYILAMALEAYTSRAGMLRGLAALAPRETYGLRCEVRRLA